MKIIDLSHTIHNSMTVFNEKERPDIRVSSNHESDGYVQSKISIYSHNGTHVDAPFHILPGYPTLDRLPPETFFGPAVMIDCTSCGEEIGVADLETHAEDISGSDFVLISTGWALKWGTSEYKKGFPVLTEDAADWLVKFKLKGIGVDCISVDPVESMDLPVHRILLGNNLLIAENLDLSSLQKNLVFDFSCFPLKFENADGSPVRAVAIFRDL